MKVTTFSKLGVSVCAAALLVGTLAAPAVADPAAATYGQLVGLGSDTTQDVVNGLAANSGGVIASYDAIGTATVTTRDGGSAVPRASGSGAGRDLLRVAIGQSPSATVAIPGSTTAVTAANSVGYIDFARSSGGPASADTRNDGVLAYIPFARDAVTIAVDPASPLTVVPFIVGDGNSAGATVPSLYNIYRGSVKFAFISGAGTELDPYVYNSVGAAAGDAPGGTTAYAIQPFLPKSGSGTRSFFIGKVGLSEANITALPAGTVKSVYGGSNTPVEEHDGTAIADDLTGIVPFSISQWVAQANAVEGVSDRRHGVVLAAMGTTDTAARVAATTGSAQFATNPAYSAMVRDVYNIVPSKLADDATSLINETFVGAASTVCLDTETITAYGFQLMPATTAASTCGYASLRAYQASASSVTLDVAGDTVTAGESFAVTATVTSNHNQGGTVFIVDADDNELTSFAVDAGETSATADVPTDAIGTLAVHAEFVPSLPGIAGSVSSASDVNVAGAPSSLTISTPSTTVVGKTNGVIVWVTGADAEGGVVTLKNGATTIGTSTLTAGEVGAYFTYKPVSTAAVALTATYRPPTDSVVLSSQSAVKNVTVGKATPVISIPTSLTSKSGKATLKVTIKATGITTVTGTVTIKDGTKTIASNKSLSAGSYSVSLSKGTHKITVIYAGSTTVASGTSTATTVKIK